MGEPNFLNRTLYHGDNLDFLRGINSETIHLIATDPPFNKGRDFHATPNSLSSGARFPDRWKWDADVHEEWVDSIKDNWPGVWAVIESARVAYGPDMAAFLCWLGVRLLEMHRILREDGSLYLHIDHTAHAYVKTLMDAIFGTANFKTEIVWKRTSAHSDTRQGRQQHGRIHDTILFYAKSGEWNWNPIYTEHDQDYVEGFYKYVEPETGRRYTLGDLTAPGGASKGNPHYELMGVTRYWRYSQERMQELVNAGRVVQTKPGAVPRYKRYLDEMPGVPLQDLWTDIGPIGSQAKERTGYPTQKPLALYERIIQASSNPGDIVLDPFCGCATTPVAAERLGRQWIGMDIWGQAHQMVLNRLETEGLAVPKAEQQPGQQRLTFADIIYSTEPPIRTDGDEIPVPKLTLRIPRPKEPWERLTNREVRAILEEAQATDNLIGCAGCGRTLESEFMELDHITPKAENGADHLLNRILLCRPCNGRKSNQLTMAGLRRQNSQAGWMKDRNLAEQSQAKALLKATSIRDNWSKFSKERI